MKIAVDAPIIKDKTIGKQLPKEEVKEEYHSHHSNSSFIATKTTIPLIKLLGHSKDSIFLTSRYFSKIVKGVTAIDWMAQNRHQHQTSQL
jgi:hypothetical protein